MNLLLLISLVFIGLVHANLNKRLVYPYPPTDDAHPQKWEFSMFAEHDSIATHHFIVAIPIDEYGKPLRSIKEPMYGPDNKLLLNSKGEPRYTYRNGIRRIDLVYKPGKIVNTIVISQKILSSVAIDGNDYFNKATYFRVGESYIGKQFSTGNQITETVRNANKGRFKDGVAYNIILNNCQHFADKLMGDIIKKF